jgi:hypothetical protein
MNEQDFVTDDDIDEMYGSDEQSQPPAQQRAMPVVPPGAHPIGNINGLPLYPLALAQVPTAPIVTGSAENLLTRKFGPLPVWGWALTALGTGIGGYFLWQSSSQKKIKSNDGDDDESASSLPEDTGRRERGSWSPSRGVFAEQLNSYFSRKNMGDKVRVYDDADVAMAKLKHVSPLINIKCEGTYRPDKDLERLCKREGLSPVVHEDGTIGLYPAKGSKRGREWEKYVDLLRDDGQKA